MIMMRSNTQTKINKPPPPVPPRPSKTIVAEALAKSRKPEKYQAPVVKSQSYSAINNYDKIVKIERGQSVEEPPRPATRTLVYQSSNAKSVGTIQEIKVNINRKESFKKENSVSRTSSFKAPQPPENVSKISFSNNCYENSVSITFKDPKTADLSRDSSLESLGESEELSRTSSIKTNDIVSSIDSVLGEDESNSWSEINDRNHVNTLIDEMFASVLDLPDEKEQLPVQVINENVTLPEKITIQQTFADEPEKTVLVIDNERKVHFESAEKKFDDKRNHEMLISELANMKHDRISKRQRKPSVELEPKIQHSDWVEVNNGQEIRLSSCQITIENDHNRFHSRMSNLHGLPPLPKSLSGFNLIENSPQTPSNRPGSSRNTTAPAYNYQHKNGDVGSLKKANNLDAKLALLRREMYSLRQLDLSLLSQLWSLNESIQDFRVILQEQDERSILSPPSPSPTPSSDEGEADEFYAPSPMLFRPAPPPPPDRRRPSNSSSGTGSSV
ncbi:PREDICTED: uncharacterized protein LOC108567179 [Nicrophorus vespilloides]|uniref:Uncharacterized protein LOC108567179 n=1 Tax=Nicrophorus vespilloides TaxID=110193 RepID=A0ABM1N848_NICVS|nr:PREDICTED: uncharacterized protein LOC108567179 [Nicrophorus vespilloides]